jgi:hypothetical protein
VNVIEKKHLFLQSQDVGIKVWILNPEKHALAGNWSSNFGF